MIATFSTISKMAARLALIWLVATPFQPASFFARCDAQDCPCGPDYCPADARYTRTMKDRKDALRKEGYPEKLLALLDKNGKCYAQISTAPEKFTIRLIYPDAKTNFPWTQHDEDLARKEVLSGAIKAYYMFNVEKAFKCCGEPSYSARKDWDPDLDLNRDLVIGCIKSGSDVACR